MSLLNFARILFFTNLVSILFIFLISDLSLAAKLKNNQIQMPKIDIGKLEYTKLPFSKGVYKKVSGPDHCIEGEYRLMRDPKSGRVFLKAGVNIFLNHLDQKVVNSQDKECLLTYFNTINENNELESTEIQSCAKPINISSIRTLKIKFEENKISYVFIFKNPTQNITKKTSCELTKAVQTSI